MNTDKLIEAIQMLIESEVKKQLKEVIAEIKSSKKQLTTEKKSTPSKGKSLSISKAILGEDVNEKEITKNTSQKEVVYTKNPVLNKILNETKKSLNEGYPGMPTKESQYEEYPTMKTPTLNPSKESSESIRMKMAQKMGYSDMTPGLGVNTGNEAVDKALNRDYRELVKRF